MAFKITVRRVINQRDNCITGHWGWPKLQITPCGTKSSWNVSVVNYNYESLSELIFCSLS
jgi:hypothetical protein